MSPTYLQCTDLFVFKILFIREEHTPVSMREGEGQKEREREREVDSLLSVEPATQVPHTDFFFNDFE